MMKVKNIPFFYTSILYVCGLLLFLEWLYPLEDLVDISNLQIFMIYTIICFFISLFHMRWYITFIFKGIGLFMIVYYLHMNDPMMIDATFQSLYHELLINMKILVSQDWGELTKIFRSLLFLLLIWLVSYLIHYWFIVMNRIFLFILLTFIYIGLLDTFTMYEANLSIIRIFIISMIAFSIANLIKNVNKEQIKFPKRRMYLSFMPIILIVLLTAFIGYIAPKSEPQWEDPVPFLLDVANYDMKKDRNQSKKAGFGDNDEKLGGSFTQDDTVVFTTNIDQQQRKHYWRVLTKDVYTGKGWKGSKKTDDQLQQADWINLNIFNDHIVPTVKRTANIDFAEGRAINRLVYPYGVREIEAKENPAYYLDAISEAISAKIDKKAVHVPSYTVTYDDPVFDISELQKNIPEDVSNDMSIYTQLPKDLPERVSDLAEEITAEHSNQYDQALAIEQYFGRSGFTYEIEGVPTPEADEDYVDQFLFETQYGYCDNYSTAMTVMLRTLDIPARWVKGFTAGEQTGQTMSTEDGDFDQYEVTNMNAHSWVEVYFPEVGWVPFEPTQGFDNLASFVDSTDDYDEEEDQKEEEEEQETDDDQVEEETENEDSLSEEDGQVEQDDQEKEAKKLKKWYVVGGLFILLLLLFILYQVRFRLKTAFLFRRFKKHNNHQVFIEAYEHLLATLEQYVHVKEPEQTLREYAREIDQHFHSIEMGQLTNYYEQLLYNDKVEESDMTKQIESWSRLMDRIFAK